jgi:DNA-binding LacI/PurR family transcriptional regulator
MSEESYFLWDNTQAAELALWKIAVAGYKNVIFVSREETAPHVRLIKKGINNVISDANLTLLDTFTVRHKETEAILHHLTNISKDTAVLCFDTELGEIVSWCATRLGKSSPKDFGLVSIIDTFGVNAGHSHTKADTAAILKDVLEYATNEKIKPFDKVQKLYRTTFCDKGTL